MCKLSLKQMIPYLNPNYSAIPCYDSGLICISILILYLFHIGCISTTEKGRQDFTSFMKLDENKFIRISFAAAFNSSNLAFMKFQLLQGWGEKVGILRELLRKSVM